MKRSTVREYAFMFLYSLEMQKKHSEINLTEQTEMFLENNVATETEKVKTFIDNMLNGINIHNEEIEKLIEKNLKADWKIDRISKINLSILKLAIYELKYEEIPFKIAINEAVELAKKYGEESARKLCKWSFSKYSKRI